MDKDAKCLSPSAIVSFLGKHNIKLRTVQRTQQQKWRNLCSNSDWWNSTLLSGNWLANQAPINKLMMQNEEIFFYKIEKTWIKYHCLDKKQCSTQSCIYRRRWWSFVARLMSTSRQIHGQIQMSVWIRKKNALAPVMKDHGESILFCEDLEKYCATSSTRGPKK